MANATGAGARRSQRDKEKSAELKRQKVERKTARCAVCYQIVHADMLREGTARHRCWKD